MQKASLEIPTSRFLNTSFQLGSAVATVQFGRYTLCGFTGFDNTYISLCDSIDWVNRRQNQVPTVPPLIRGSNLPKCGINGYNAAAAHLPMAMSVGGPPYITNSIQTTLVNEFPWQVAISVFCQSHPRGSICATCSGVIVNNNWVLTTRTCFSGRTGFNITHTLLTDMLPDVERVVVRFGAQEQPRVSGPDRTQPVYTKHEFNLTIGKSDIHYDPTRTFAMIKLPGKINPFVLVRDE